MKSLMKQGSACLVLILALTGCSSTKYATTFNGMSTPAGKPIAHASTSNMAIHLLLGKKPVWGNATLDQTVSDFTAAAKAQGGKEVQIVQSSSQAWWFLFFPFTLLVTPVTSNVAGDVL